MYLADYHVHSRISPDASASMQEMAEAAIRLGFQEICFTDHVEPIRFGTTEPRGAYDWDPMIAEFRAARTAVGDRITLRLGAELGDAVWGIRRMESMLAEAPPLDFLIGSIHTLSEKMEAGTCISLPRGMNRKRGTALPTTWARCGSSRSGGDSRYWAI